jgi:nucleoside-diphosphate-sugar epimerase
MNAAHRVYILGAGGFVGRHIAANFPVDRADLCACGRSAFELGNPADYSRYSFANSTIVDCMSQIDGTREEVYRNNSTKFVAFIDHLNRCREPFRYVYFSTLSTNDERLAERNAYVGSKRAAEEYLMGNVMDYRIVKLSFPFGEGESPNRLVSRLIAQVINREPLELADMMLSLTPIGALQQDLASLLDARAGVVQYYNRHTVHLEDVVRAIGSELDIACSYRVDANPAPEIRPSEAFPVISRTTDPLDAIRRMARNAAARLGHMVGQPQ